MLVVYLYCLNTHAHGRENSRARRGRRRVTSGPVPERIKNNLNSMRPYRETMHIVQPGMEIDVLKENNKIAHENYRLMKEHGIKSVDFMGSIGAGKTSLIIKLA